MSIKHLFDKREQLAAEIAAHEAMIADARKQEQAEALGRIKTIMSEHGITVDHLGKKAPKAPRKAPQKAAGITYNIGGVIYTTGRVGKPPAAYLQAKAAGTLDQYRAGA